MVCGILSEIMWLKDPFLLIRKSSLCSGGNRFPLSLSEWSLSVDRYSFQRALRQMLAYTPCRDKQQQNRLQTRIKPIVDAIILKCTDGNKYVWCKPLRKLLT